MSDYRRRKPAYCTCPACRGAESMSARILIRSTATMMVIAITLSLLFA